MSQNWSFVLDKPARILIADDDPILREFAMVHLATPVVPVEAAADGEEAWTRLLESPFDILLLDLGMPRLDGFGVLERMRADARFADLPVIVLTGREDVASIDRAFEKGATSFVTKPVNWRQLSHQIRYVLRSHGVESTLRAERDSARDALADLSRRIDDFAQSAPPVADALRELSVHARRIMQACSSTDPTGPASSLPDGSSLTTWGRTTTAA